jgi:hypothetical protein
VYVVRAEIRNCLDVKGARARIFTEAQERQAYYSKASPDTAIHYDGQDLRIDLNFELKEKANDMQSWLVLADAGRLLVASLKGRIHDIRVEASSAVTLGERVLVSDYDPSTSTSPAETYADILPEESVSTHSTATITSEFVQCQSIETSRALQICGVDRAHIIPRGECAKRRVVDDTNNLLALTKTLHYMWDGPHHKVPVFGIRPAVEGEPFFTPEYQSDSNRHRVGVVVVPRDVGDADIVARDLKEGTVRTLDAEGGVCFGSWVDVLDPNVFCTNLRTRFAMTRAEWSAP